MMNIWSSCSLKKKKKKSSYIDKVSWTNRRLLKLCQQVSEALKVYVNGNSFKIFSIFKDRKENRSPFTRLLSHIFFSSPTNHRGLQNKRNANMKIMSDLKVNLPYLSRKPTVHLKTPPKATSSPNITEK